MTEQQWNEFLDKLDFVQLSERWELLPLHWLDSELPESADELASELVTALLGLKEEEDEDSKLSGVAKACRAYRTRRGAQVLSLDARLCPPGSRVTLRYLDPENLGAGDCLITLGSWDRVGHLLSEKNESENDFPSSVGENPLRHDATELQFRNILLFPDKGTPSPRAFRSLCEKTLRQARGLGAKHLTTTHLHLPQTGLADRFAAAELVSAIRQMLRESPGTTVEILAYSHRNYEDYEHWFESLKALAKGQESTEASSPTPEEPAMDEAAADIDGDGVDVAQTLRSFAKRSSDLATEAGASVSRWFSGVSEQSESTAVQSWREPSFEEQLSLSRLFLGQSLDAEKLEFQDSLSQYIFYLNETVKLEQDFQEKKSAELAQNLAIQVSAEFPLARYWKLLRWRCSRLDGNEELTSLLSELTDDANKWQDLPLLHFVESQARQGTDEQGEKLQFIPVFPRGCLASLKG